MRILSSEDTLLPPCEETTNLFQAKYQSASDSEDVNIPTPPSQHLEHALTESDEQVLTSIHTMPSGSVAGLDGMVPSFSKQLTSQELDEDGRRFLRSITKLANLLLKSQVPEFARGAELGTSLVVF